MRATLHYCLSALLAIVSVSAPFAHTHDSGKAEEHLAQEHFSILHAHIALPGEDAAVSEVDDSARRVNWFRFDHEKTVSLSPPAGGLALPLPELDPSAGFVLEESQPLPEESPPRTVSPRGPPLLFV